MVYAAATIKCAEADGWTRGEADAALSTGGCLWNGGKHAPSKLQFIISHGLLGRKVILFFKED